MRWKVVRRRGRRVKRHEAASTKVGDDQGTQQSADAVLLLLVLYIALDFFIPYFPFSSSFVSVSSDWTVLVLTLDAFGSSFFIFHSISRVSLNLLTLTDLLPWVIYRPTKPLVEYLQILSTILHQKSSVVSRCTITLSALDRKPVSIPQ